MDAEEVPLLFTRQGEKPMQPGAEGHGGDHGAGHGGDHGGDHSPHAHPPESHAHSSASGTSWSFPGWVFTIITGVATIFLALILVAIAGWATSRMWTIGRLETELAQLKEKLDQKADKAEVAQLKEKVEQKADISDVKNLGDKIEKKG
jgi:hypothetical protein